MLFDNDISSRLYSNLSELEEKLLKSESERRVLEAKFQYLTNTYKNEEERRLNRLKEKYAEFLDECKERSKRNDDILQSLQKVETGATAVFAKTERLKQLRSHYDAYLSRAVPLWRHPDVLQLEGSRSELGHPASWIREPRMVAPTVRPALLLPGGGAVMLPVDETGRNLPPGPMYPLPEVQSLWVPPVETDIRQFKPLDKRMTSVSFSTLGEAGERMMKELGLGTSHGLDPPKMPSLAMPPPVMYQQYHLPVYIPPSYSFPSFCGSPGLNERVAHSVPVSSDVPVFNNGSNKSRFGVPERMKAWSSRKENEMPGALYPDSSKPSDREVSKRRYDPNTASENINSDISRSEPRVSNKAIVDTSCDNMYFAKKKDQAEKTRDNFEIECLAADNNIEEDPNWSDDEVLDVIMGRTHSPCQDDVNEILPQSDRWKSDRRGEQTNNAPIDRNNYRLQSMDPKSKPAYRDMNQRVEHDEPEYQQSHQMRRAPNSPLKHSDIGGPVAQIAQKVVVAHQKSINDLKAILSFEENETPPGHEIPEQAESFSVPEQGNQGAFLVDEDVPEDFTEQNYPESHYDPRYQRDVSRNVILEEDEEEEEEKPVITKPVIPALGRRDDWRRLQQYRQQGKLTSANIPLHSEYQPAPQSQADGRSHEPPLSPQQYNQQFGAIHSPSDPSLNNSRLPPNEGRTETSPAGGTSSRPRSGENKSSRQVTEGYGEGPDSRQQSLDHYYREDLERQRSPTARSQQQEVFEQNVGARDRQPSQDREEYNQLPQMNPSFQREPSAEGFVGDQGSLYRQEGGYGGEPVESFPDQQHEYEQQPPHQELDQRPEQFDGYQQEGYENQPINSDDQHVDYSNAPQQDDQYYQNRDVQYYQDHGPLGEYPPQEIGQGDTENYEQHNQLPPHQQQHPDYNRYEEYSENPENCSQGNEYHQKENVEVEQQEQYDDYRRETGPPGETNVEAPQYRYDEQESSHPRGPGDPLGSYPEEPSTNFQHDGNEFEENPPQNVDYGQPSDPINKAATPPSGPKPSVVNQLMDSESESYQVEPAGSAHDDSDFDFSIGKQ